MQKGKMSKIDIRNDQGLFANHIRFGVIDAAIEWRKSSKDIIDADIGCDCELCKLIRACDKYLEYTK